ENIALQGRSDIGQEHELRIAVFFREFRLEVCEDIQLRRQRHALVQVLRIAARPEERFPRGALQTLDVNRAPAKNLSINLREVVANDAHEIHAGEETGRHGKISGRAAQSTVYFSVRTLEGIERNGPYNEQGHYFLLKVVFRSNFECLA